MTLQQLRYLLAIAQRGSISAAAHDLYISQSSLSVAIKDIEQECGITIFERSNRGVTITQDGLEFLGYARQIVEQADLMSARYSKDAKAIPQHLAISSQHYSFPVEAFIEFVKEYEGEDYSFSLRETRTAEIIEDVSEFRSDIGILYMSGTNEAVLQKAFEDANVTFTPLFSARPHVFVGTNHPLATRKSLDFDDLADYPRYSFEQGTMNSFYYAEEPFAEIPHSRTIAVSDRGTLSNLLAHHNGYTLSTGILSNEMHTGIAAVPLNTNERMTVGYITQNERQLTNLAQRYIETLLLFVEDYNKSYAEL